MSEKPRTAITLTVITAVATIAAAWISRSGNDEKSAVNSPEAPIAVQTPQGQPTLPESRPIRPVGGKLYETTKIVRENSAFTDPETGLTFGVEEVYNQSESWFYPAMKGATITYTLPNGKSDYGGRDPGFRVDFTFRGRSFLMVIEDMDFQGRTVTIRIKEI